jgi:hypothetical protein
VFFLSSIIAQSRKELEMENDKNEYIYNHVLTIKESLAIVQQSLKLISSDIKFIEKISKQKSPS